MEARRYKRKIVTLQAELIAGGTRYACFIENLSEEGAYITIAQANPQVDFKSDTPFELKFRFPSGEKLNLSCRVKWSYRTPPHGYTNSVGLEIMDPPPLYTEALKTLQ